MFKKWRTSCPDANRFFTLSELKRTRRNCVLTNPNPNPEAELVVSPLAASEKVGNNHFQRRSKCAQSASRGRCGSDSQTGESQNNLTEPKGFLQHNESFCVGIFYTTFVFTDCQSVVCLHQTSVLVQQELTSRCFVQCVFVVCFNKMILFRCCCSSSFNTISIEPLARQAFHHEWYYFTLYSKSNSATCVETPTSTQSRPHRSTRASDFRQTPALKWQ